MDILPKEMWSYILFYGEAKTLCLVCKTLNGLLVGEMKLLKYHKAKSFIKRNELLSEWNTDSEYLALFKGLNEGAWRHYLHLKDLTHWLFGGGKRPFDYSFRDYTLDDQLTWRCSKPVEIQYYKGLDISKMPFHELAQALRTLHFWNDDPSPTLNLGYTFGLNRDLTADFINNFELQWEESFMDGYALGIVDNPEISNLDILGIAEGNSGVSICMSELYKREGLDTQVFQSNSRLHISLFASEGILTESNLAKYIEMVPSNPSLLAKLSTNSSLTWDLLKPYASMFEDYWDTLLLFVDVDFETWKAKMPHLQSRKGQALGAIINPRFTFEETDKALRYLKTLNQM